MKTADILIQAGHENRTSGATGAESEWGSEQEWTPIVADEATRILRDAGISVIREDAFLDPDKYRVNLALFIHFDSADPVCRSGASIGYDDPTDKPAADDWKSLYSRYWPFRWMSDNFTNNLRNYYGYRYTITSDAEMVLELGELTCREQALWLKTRLLWLGALIAHFASGRLRKGNVPDPGDFDDTLFNNGGTLVRPPEVKCSNSWTITGYYTPKESDFKGPKNKKIYIRKHGYESFAPAFIDETELEGWGRTRNGWCLGYYKVNGVYQYHKSPEPLDARGKPLSQQKVAVDPRRIRLGASVEVYDIPELKGEVFDAADVGSGIRGKHIDVYCGEGKTALAKTYAITRKRPEEKVKVCSNGMV
ncbi:MAG: 3D domain-containing protein [Verrucomicrobiota bacterium]